MKTVREWLKGAPSPEKQEVDLQAVRLEMERHKRKSAFSRLLSAIDEIPIEEGITAIGHDIGKGRCRT